MVSAEGVRRPAGSFEHAMHTELRRTTRAPMWQGKAEAVNQPIYYGEYFTPAVQAGDSAVQVAAGSAREDIWGLH